MNFTGNCLKTLNGHNLPVWSISLTPDGERIVSGSGDKTIKVWDIYTGKCIKTLNGHQDCVRSVAVTPDGERIVSGSGDKTIKVWDIYTGKCMKTLNGHLNYVNSVAVTPDGKRIVSDRGDKTINIWDIETGICLKTLNGHQMYVYSVAITPDGKRIVSGSFDNTIKIWDIETGNCLKTLNGHNNYVHSVSVTSDGKRIVSGSWDNTIKIWDVETGGCLKTLNGHQKYVRSVAITPGGKRIVSGGADNTIKLWDIETGICLKTLNGHQNHVNSVAITPDGKRIVSGSDDYTSKVWDIAVKDALNETTGPSKPVNPGIKIANLKEASAMNMVKKLDSFPEDLFWNDIVLSTKHLLEAFIVINKVENVSSFKESKDNDVKLNENAKIISKLQTQYYRICSLLRNNVVDSLVSERESVKKKLLQTRQERIALLKHKMSVLDNNKMKKELISKIAAHYTDMKAVEVVDPSSIIMKMQEIVVKVQEKFMPKAIRYRELEDEMKVWDSRELTWINIFLYAEDIQSFSDKAKELFSLKPIVLDLKHSLETQMSNLRNQIYSYCNSVKSATDRDDGLWVATRDDLVDSQNETQILVDVNTLAEKVRKLHAEKVDLLSYIAVDTENMDRTRIEIKYMKDKSKLAKLKEKEKEIQKELDRKYAKVLEIDKLIQNDHVDLQKHLPELLGENLTDLAFGSQAREFILDTETSFDDFHIERDVTDKVYIVYDKYGQKYVLKKLVNQTEFKKEAERLWKLRHPLIVPIIKVFPDRKLPDSICFMQMPYYERGNLREWCKRMQDHVQELRCFNEHQEFVEVQHTFSQIAQALAHIHAKGIVHRDLKPENVLLSSSGNIALCDFGISSDFSQSFATTIISGTSGYMAPEGPDWKRNPTAVDMWSFGCMMFELLLKLLPAVTNLRSEPTLATMNWTQFKWNDLNDFFSDAHMKGYVRVCRQLLNQKPEERLSANEVLLDPILRATTLKIDPASTISLVLPALAATRGSDTFVINIPNSDNEERIFRFLLKQFASLKDIHHRLMILDHRGYQKPLGEIMELFFNQLKLPKYGLFTQALDDDSSENTSNVFMNKAFLPKIKADGEMFRTVGKVLGKCLIEGIKVPLQLNTCCWEYILEQRNELKDVDVALSFLSETCFEDVVLYRNLLYQRQKGEIEIGVLLKSESAQLLTDENKNQVVAESIWKKLVETRRSSLEQIREGLCSLKAYEKLKNIPGKSVQTLFSGSDFVDVKDMKRRLHFTADTWTDASVMRKVSGWMIDWLSDISDLTIRLLLLRLFGTYYFEEFPNVFVVQSTDKDVGFVQGGIIRVPATCENYNEFKQLFEKELVMVALKSDVERRNQITNEEVNAILKAMGTEIKAGGWYRCENGHPYAVGECGGPMQKAQCPECKKNIGGQNHRLNDGNTHFGFDGSAAPAWPQPQLRG